MGRCIWLVAALLLVVLAATIGARLGDEALALVAGLMLGAGVAIPTCLLIVGTAGGRRERPRARGPVVVITARQRGRQPREWGILPPRSWPGNG